MIYQYFLSELHLYKIKNLAKLQYSKWLYFQGAAFCYSIEPLVFFEVIIFAYCLIVSLSFKKTHAKIYGLQIKVSHSFHILANSGTCGKKLIKGTLIEPNQPDMTLLKSNFVNEGQNSMLLHVSPIDNSLIHSFYQACKFHAFFQNR